MATGNTDNNMLVMTEALNKLQKMNYKLKFRREAACLYCFQLLEWIVPENFTVDDYYYFEDLLNPDEERILYAISLAGGQKGVLIDSCNVYADNISREMMEKLALNKTGSRRNDLPDAGKITKQDRLIDEAIVL